MFEKLRMFIKRDHFFFSNDGLIAKACNTPQNCGSDLGMSRDLEDIIYVIDNNVNLINDVVFAVKDVQVMALKRIP